MKKNKTILVAVFFLCYSANSVVVVAVNSCFSCCCFLISLSIAFETLTLLQSSVYNKNYIICNELHEDI